MGKRYMSVWFSHLSTDWISKQRPELSDKAFVFGSREHGRIVIKSANVLAERIGIHAGMVASDAKAILPELEVIEEIPGLEIKLLKAIGKWGIRYTPFIALDPPDGLILDISGCAHLWGGEQNYLKEIADRIRSKGYHARMAISETPGSAWASARFGINAAIIGPGKQMEALSELPPAALRLEKEILSRMAKLGFNSIRQFVNVPRSVLRRRFGEILLLRLDQALGNIEEPLIPLMPVEPYQERLVSLEPIRTLTGIEIALKELLEKLCGRLKKEGKGLRYAVFKCCRIDGKMEQVSIGTHRGTHQAEHIFRLFQLKLSGIRPALGIELFILEAPKTEDIEPGQEQLWNDQGSLLQEQQLAELLDRVSGKVGSHCIKQYLPDERYWPERAIVQADQVLKNKDAFWRTDKPRPVQLLPKPIRIEVSAPIPDYPPMLFRHLDTVHHIRKADGPERIEREWWLEHGEHRDYYIVEDTEGNRFWLFRAGHYSAEGTHWFLHGYFA